ncbi:hypothetical protein [Nocardioides sp. SR21]|uniref:DUF6916 family protein n=1 Tax=Nocardioides sp. SR21 TaxID=2919501 RepID=UPI001FAA69A1|nr:hypothetical protein [Nocardioides sp. SR21]
MDVSFDLLTDLVGEDLEITAAEDVTGTLRIARATPNEGGTGGTVVLVGPSDPAFGQGTYPIRHAEHGEGVLFIVPVGDDGTQRTYEAVFG